MSFAYIQDSETQKPAGSRLLGSIDRSVKMPDQISIWLFLPDGYLANGHALTGLNPEIVNTPLKL
jgi:hypothetical protein